MSGSIRGGGDQARADKALKPAAVIVQSRPVVEGEINHNKA